MPGVGGVGAVVVIVGHAVLVPVVVACVSDEVPVGSSCLGLGCRGSCLRRRGAVPVPVVVACVSDEVPVGVLLPGVGGVGAVVFVVGHAVPVPVVVACVSDEVTVGVLLPGVGGVGAVVFVVGRLVVAVEVDDQLIDGAVARRVPDGVALCHLHVVGVVGEAHALEREVQAPSAQAVDQAGAVEAVRRRVDGHTEVLVGAAEVALVVGAGEGGLRVVRGRVDRRRLGRGRVDGPGVGGRRRVDVACAVDARTLRTWAPSLSAAVVKSSGQLTKPAPSRSHS